VRSGKPCPAWSAEDPLPPPDNGQCGLWGEVFGQHCRGTPESGGGSDTETFPPDEPSLQIGCLQYSMQTRAIPAGPVPPSSPYPVHLKDVLGKGCWSIFRRHGRASVDSDTGPTGQLFHTQSIGMLYTCVKGRWVMRTNVVLDDDLVEQAKRLTGIKTKREVIHEALRTLIRLREQSEVRTLRGKLRWEGDLASLQESRRHDLG
jgi:Arc/MetJ family transcription regulator